MGQIIDGKAVSAAVKAEVAEETAKLREEKGLKVGLAVVIVGNNPASRVYVNNKKKACEAVGFQSFEYALPEETTQEQLLDYADEMQLELMTDDQNKIIIMDDKDLGMFVNLLSEDYFVSPVNGRRYEIKSKKLLDEPEGEPPRG